MSHVACKGVMSHEGQLAPKGLRLTDGTLGELENELAAERRARADYERQIFEVCTNESCYK